MRVVQHLLLHTRCSTLIMQLPVRAGVHLHLLSLSLETIDLTFTHSCLSHPYWFARSQTTSGCSVVSNRIANNAPRRSVVVLCAFECSTLSTRYTWLMQLRLKQTRFGALDAIFITWFSLNLFSESEICLIGVLKFIKIILNSPFPRS